MKPGTPITDYYQFKASTQIDKIDQGQQKDKAKFVSIQMKARSSAKKIQIVDK